MARVFYGVWNGEVYDHRDMIPVDVEEFKELHGIDFFNEGNPIKAFFGDKGFLVFDMSVNLLDAFWRHMKKSRDESCGKCTPCRMGTKIIVDKLNTLRRGEGDDTVWNDVYELAQQMKKSSLCGLGKTAALALIDAFDNFRDKLEEGATGEDTDSITQNGMSYMTAPCIEACPSKLNVPRYISYVRDGKPTHSLGVVLQKYPMAATCGRVCVRFCEMACKRNLVDDAVGIKILKRYVADYQKGVRSDMFTKSMCTDPQPENLKVAVIGSGPGGIACAYHLLLKGYQVDVFESHDSAGGMAARGIPDYRLPKDVLDEETSIITSLGGKFKFNQELGKDFTVDDLMKQGYKAVHVAVGCAKGTMMNITGEDVTLDGYTPGIGFLMNVHKHVDGKLDFTQSGKIVVVGGGNVAMDCARSAIRLGADEVHVVYRRAREDMPADKEEVDAAEKEGVIFHFLTNPSKICSKDGKVTAVEVVNMEQTEPGKDGRRQVVPKRGSEKEFECDMVIAAIGQRIDPDTFTESDGVELDKWGCIKVDSMTQETSRRGVFAGGDCARGPATLIHAMADGLNAACSIDEYLHFGKVRFSPLNRMRQILKDNEMLAEECVEEPVKSFFRVHHPELDLNVRKKEFEEVEIGIERQAAYAESLRCLRCYRVYSVITESPIVGASATQDNETGKSVANV